MTPEEKADRDRHNAARLAPRMTLDAFNAWRHVFDALWVAMARANERMMLGIDPAPPPLGILAPPGSTRPPG